MKSKKPFSDEFLTSIVQLKEVFDNFRNAPNFYLNLAGCVPFKTTTIPFALMSKGINQSVIEELERFYVQFNHNFETTHDFINKIHNQLTSFLTDQLEEYEKNPEKFKGKIKVVVDGETMESTLAKLAEETAELESEEKATEEVKVSDEFKENIERIYKILKYFTKIPDLAEVCKGRDFEQTPLTVLLTYEDLSMDVIQEFKGIYDKCERDIYKMLKYLSNVHNVGLQLVEKSQIQDKKTFTVRKIMEFGMVLFSPEIKLNINGKKTLNEYLGNFKEDRIDPELWEKAIQNVYSIKENWTIISRSDDKMQSKAEEMINFMECIHYDFCAIDQTMNMIADKIKKGILFDDAEVCLNVIEKNPTFNLNNVTLH